MSPHEPVRRDADRPALQARLDRINQGHDPLLGRVLPLLVRGDAVGIAGTFPRLQRDGDRISVRWTPRSDEDRDFMELVNLIMRVGIDRVRQCRRPTCYRWYVAAKAQLYCSLRHAQDDRNDRRSKQTAHHD